MKKLYLLLLIFFCGMITANAQFVYTPYTPNSSQSTTQSQEPTTRTTAYYIDSYSGTIYKVPIRIQQQTDAWGNIAYSVIEYYIDSGVGGRWQRLTFPSQINKCNSIFASNSLEKQFMYKALVNTQTYYFDF